MVSERLKKILTSYEMYQCVLTTLSPLIFVLFLIIALLTSIPPHAPTRPSTPTKPYFVLLQISDIHVNTFLDGHEVGNLRQFCSELPKITPDGVIVTGDLCHSRRRGIGFYPEKHEDEYDLYSSTVSDCMALYNTTWYDLRGNHDVDGVYGRDNALMYVEQHLHSNIDVMSVNYIEFKKGEDSVRVVGVDSYLNAMISMEIEGFLSENNVGKLFELFDSDNTYKVLATHHPSTGIISNNKRYLSDLIDEKYGENNPISIAICGHYHRDYAAAYHNHYFDAELVTLQYGKYRVLVFKNRVAQYFDFVIGELPIVPICPGEKVTCETTEIYIGYIVDSVKVIGLKTRKVEELTSEDKHLWTSPLKFEEDIKVVVSYEGNEIEREFKFGSQYNHFMNGFFIMWRLKDCAIGFSALAFILLCLRIFSGLFSRKFVVLQKIPILGHYSFVPQPILLFGLFLAVLMYFIPMIVGYNYFQDHGNMVLVYAGVNFAKIGIFGSHFVSHGYAVHGFACIYIWMFLYTVGHSYKKNLKRTEIGIDLLWILWLIFGVAYSYMLHISFFFFSPLSFIQFILLVIAKYICWYNSKYKPEKQDEEKDDIKTPLTHIADQSKGDDKEENVPL
ncbi:hypothetical protein EIN_082120 [Entamoeba invadens IP1]|uniref:hypothetical protein n=1 Tax=Entamoeba invadens IP1 TaxID=370355 RepID=UPI0002C3F43F|nr:hypothetical protein EIN_082120 [Entamoeba invadens IP1]ELP85160.1 hypothetical protein EIN_082120 [Entamoeba invadens IP1]|eukprot:XP_004184506.1 hypothetical protein EIN_082120 [Entamoeba invadens IP1]